jgi:hypothetical protein
VVAVAPDAVESRTVVSAVADDGVLAINVGGSTFSGHIIVSDANATAHHGVFSFRTASTPLCRAISSSGLSVTTGALTGTTGADGAATLSAHTDHKVYLENRLGAIVTFCVTVITSGWA